MCDGAGATSWSYDAEGNALTEKRTTNSVTDSLTYTYNLDSGVASVTYPSSRTITYQPGGAQRPLWGVDTTNSVNYAWGPCTNSTSTTGACYAPHGGVSNLNDGASVVSTLFYNDRLQPCRISAQSSGTAPSSCTDSGHTGNVMDLTYSFDAGSSDNGNVWGVTNNIDSTRSQSFGYDSLNRVATAAASNYATSPSHCWGEAFSIDRYGNLTGISAISGGAYSGCTQESLSILVSSTTNRITTSGFTYDSSGDLTSDGTNSPSYDAEGRIVSVGGVTYYYDGDGKRVRKSSGTIYWYGTSSDPMLETDGSGTLQDEYIFFNGKRVARRDSSGNIDYYLADKLGTARVVTNASGTIQDDSDFYPYGGERVVSSGSGNDYKFTGKMRDTESGLDDFGARYYSSQYGRFMIPDWSAKPQGVPYAQLDDPQSLNLYSYVRDNPLSDVDADGHSVSGGGAGGPAGSPAASCTKTNSQSDVCQGDASAQNKDADHPEHTAKLGGAVLQDKGNGLSGKADVGYATAQNTSGKGDLSGAVGVGGAKVVMNSTDGGNTSGQAELQLFTADANGKGGTGGFAGGATARVFEGSGQLSFAIAGYSVTVKGTVSAVGYGINGHITWSNGISMGGSGIAGLVGAGLSVTVRHSGDN